MNGATLLSATVVTHNKVIINDNNKLANESNDDETESESDDDDYYNEICDESSNLSLTKISNRDKSSEQKNSSRNNSLERGNSIRLRSNRKSKCSEPNNKLDSIRFSMYAIQNSQLNEIDALLSELNQLQNTLDYSSKNDIMNMKPKLSSPIKNISLKNNENNKNHLDEIEAIDQQFDEVLKFLAESINEQTGNQSSSAASSPNHNQPKNDRSSGSSNSSGIGDDFESPTSTAIKNLNNQEIKHQLKKRNSTDSAFLETISMPSSHSLANLETNNNNNNNKNLIKSKSQNANFLNASNISTNSSVTGELSPSSQKSSEVVLIEKSLSPTQIAEAQKAEMIRVALEKLKEANIKKLIVKAYTDDGCTKSVIIDETMKSYDVMLLLFSKNHTKPSVKYSIVEYLPKFHMERIFEDHENIVEAMSNWSRDSENQIIFTEKEAKYDLFIRPEFYLLSESINKIDENHRNKILNNIGSSVPDIEGPLYIKVESKKSWKKYYCVLRQSGLYYIPKGKNKKDLQCLFNFEKLDLYFGIEWRKKFKAPTNSCFALKLPQVQKKSSKYIKYLCCENEQDMKRWFNGIRIAKFGKQLYENYKKMLELIEMNKVSGRLPMASSRRLSASINNKNQRPRSSYSLLNGEELNINTNIKETNDGSCIKQNNLENQNINIDNNNSTLLAKQQFVENNSNEETSTKEIKKLIEETYKQKQINLSYTEQLKSLLEAHQNFNQKSISNNQSLEHASASILNDNISNKSWTSPISVSTNDINNSVQINQNKNNKISLSNGVNKQMLNNSNNNNIQFDSYSSPSSLSPNSQQLFLSSPNLTESNDLFKRPKQLDLNSKIPIVKMNNNQPISPTSSNKSEIKIDINGFIKEPECVYDLPTPPMEIFNTSPKLNGFEVTNKIPLPSPTQSSMVQSQIIVQLADNRNSKCMVPQPQSQLSNAQKPVFKRFNSFTNDHPDEKYDKMKNFRGYESNDRKSINNNSNMNNHSRGSSLSRTSSLFQQQQQQQNESCNELAAILARQKKKIEAQIGDSVTIFNQNTNPIKMPSPNISRKPPPPPRNDRSQSFTRKMSSEY